MKLLFENWRAYLNEGQKQELWQAMIDASPGGKWRKLAYKHPTRVAYRDYLASSAGQGGKGGPLVTPPDEEDDGGWECAEGDVEDASGNCMPIEDPEPPPEPDPTQGGRMDIRSHPTYPICFSNICPPEKSRKPPGRGNGAKWYWYDTKEEKYGNAPTYQEFKKYKTYLASKGKPGPNTRDPRLEPKRTQPRRARARPSRKPPS